MTTDIKTIKKNAENGINVSVKELADALPFTEADENGHVIVHIGDSAFKRTFTGIRMQRFDNYEEIEGTEAWSEKPESESYLDADGDEYDDYDEINDAIVSDADEGFTPVLELRDGVEDDGTESALDLLLRHADSWELAE